jgi:hypothetical protein
MKRRFALVAAILVLCTGNQRSHACCCEMSYRSTNSSFVIGDTRWILYNGVVYRNTMSTDAVTVSQRNSWARSTSRLPFAPIDRTTFPSLLRYTSRTTPLVAGPIAQIFLDDRNRLWAFNEAGDASMFDGVAWETFLHQKGSLSDDLSYGYGEGLDVVMKDGVIRIAAPMYVDEIDMHRLVRRRLLEANGALQGPQFLGMDTILSIGYRRLILIDLVSNTIEIDRRIAEADEEVYNHYEPKILDVRMPSSPIEVRTTQHQAGEFEQRCQAMYLQIPHVLASPHIFSTLRSVNVPVRDTVYQFGSTPERPGAYLDMVADKNGTIYLAGFDGITVIPMTTEEDVTHDGPTPLAMATLYPNPATHHVTIGLDTAPTQRVSALIVDASGTTVATTDLRDPSTLVDLTSYPNGMYTVVLTSDRASVARSLIVQR